MAARTEVEVEVEPGVEHAGDFAEAARELRLLATELSGDWAELRRRAQASREQRQRERARLDGVGAALLALTKDPPEPFPRRAERERGRVQ